MSGQGLAHPPGGEVKRMSYIKHEHKAECSRYQFDEWIPHTAPDVLWFNIQDVGSYQGSVYGFGLYKGKLLVYEDYYGSCSGCGAWGEGGEPESQEEILGRSKLFDTLDEALDYLPKIDHYDNPDRKVATEALKEIEAFRKSTPQEG